MDKFGENTAMLSTRFRNSRFATTSKVSNLLQIFMTLSIMSNENIHIVKQKSSNREKINYDPKCAKIEFSCERDAQIVNFQGKFATSSQRPRADRAKMIHCSIDLSSLNAIW